MQWLLPCNVATHDGTQSMLSMLGFGLGQQVAQVQLSVLAP